MMRGAVYGVFSPEFVATPKVPPPPILAASKVIVLSNREAH
jgi:hypothetical protein